jgi:hypothetical protein
VKDDRSEVDLPFDSSVGSCVLRVSLPPRFPNERPVLQLVGMPTRYPHELVNERNQVCVCVATILLWRWPTRE